MQPAKVVAVLLIVGMQHVAFACCMMRRNFIIGARSWNAVAKAFASKVSYATTSIYSEGHRFHPKLVVIQIVGRGTVCR